VGNASGEPHPRTAAGAIAVQYICRQEMEAAKTQHEQDIVAKRFVDRAKTAGKQSLKKE
jgi:hypothetical protein